MTSTTVTDGGVTVQRLADVLRTPEDLEKIGALKAELLRKKADVDARLREGLKEHLETTQIGMSSLGEGQKLVGQIKEEMKSIHDLCEQSQAIRNNFPQIDYLARVHRNFEATKAMQAGLQSFNEDCAEVRKLLEDDETDLENQPNLLQIHMKLTRLRDFRDEALDQIRRAKDNSLENTLEEYFEALDSVIEMFDEHIGSICMDLIDLVQRDNNGIIVRLAIVIASEEKNDDRVRALQDAQKDHQDLVSKFTSFTIGPKTIRGYKEKFLQAIKAVAQAKFENTRVAFLDDPTKLNKQTSWFFNDLFACKQGMQNLFPKKWRIFRTYVDIYHKEMHDFLLSFVDAEDLRPPTMLAIVHYIDVYYKKMHKMGGFSQTDLTPHVLDGREADLVREYRNLITTTLNSWIDRMFVTDRNAFTSRTDSDLQQIDGVLRTTTLGDMWRMLHEQAEAAGNSEREDVVEGVMSAMFAALKARQQQWENLIDQEVAKVRNAGTESSDNLSNLQAWLLAIANDQIACIDDAGADVDDPTAQLSYLTRFRDDFAKLPTPPSSKFMTTIAKTEIDAITLGYIDLSTFCINKFVSLIFAIDFRTIMAEFFVPGKWYEQAAMKRITATFDDYMADYSGAMHHSLVDILVEEMSGALLVAYLTAIRTNRGVKFRRQDPFGQKLTDDVLAAFSFFGKYPSSFEGPVGVRETWKVVKFTADLLAADKSDVVRVYQEFKAAYWDLQLSWVEGVLRTRDDWDRGMISAVKQAAATSYAERSAETVMGKVK